MKKYLAEVYLPSVDKRFDVYLPAQKQIGESVQLLIKMTETLTEGKYKGSGSSMLLDAKSGIEIPKNISVHEAGIRNSSKLILI